MTPRSKVLLRLALCAGFVHLASVAHAAREPRWGTPVDDGSRAEPARKRRPGKVGFGVRLGTASLALSARDMPAAGDDLDRIAGVLSHDASELDLRERLWTVAPTLHVGGEGYFFKAEAPVGFGRAMNTFGLGIYPLNFGVFVPSLSAMPYVSAGVVGSYVVADSRRGRGNGKHASGALVQARTAVGVKLLPGPGPDLSLELGWSPWAAGAVFSPAELDEARTQFENGAPVNQPDRVLRAGAGTVVDLSLGIGWL